jgi:hypothetical protein
MLLQNPPTPLNEVVLAVIGREVQQLNRCSNLVAKRYQSVQKLRSSPTINLRFQDDFLTNLVLLTLPKREVASFSEITLLGKTTFGGSIGLAAGNVTLSGL